ncbi:MAG: hypothetical protein D3923_17040 [Candidatus Electrothrix sp. AR3]|nr:hypothetical protein [Candidatus Electrothrix sp. AR3]
MFGNYSSYTLLAGGDNFVLPDAGIINFYLVISRGLFWYFFHDVRGITRKNKGTETILHSLLCKIYMVHGSVFRRNKKRSPQKLRASKQMSGRMGKYFVFFILRLQP